MGSILSFVVIIAIFYFFLYAPQQKQQKKVKEMMNNLKVGDVILTRGGIQGKIMNLNESLVTIATGPQDVQINVTRQGIGSVIEQAALNDEAEYETAAEEQDEDSNSGKINLEKKEE